MKSNAIEIPQQVLNALALTFVPMSKVDLKSYLLTWYSATVADITVNKLIQQHLLQEVHTASFYTKYTMDAGLRLKFLDWIHDEPAKDREKLLAEVASQSKYKRSYYYEEKPGMLREQLIRALVFSDNSEGNAYCPGNSDTRNSDEYEETDAPLLETIYAIISNEEYSSKYEQLVANMPAEVLYDLSNKIDLDMQTGNWSYDYERISGIVSEDKSLFEEERSYLQEFFSWPLNLFRGDFENLRFDASSVYTFYGCTTLAVKSMADGDGKKAEKYFRAALKLHNGNVYSNCFLNLMLVCAMKMSGSAMALKTLDGYARKDVFSKKAADFATKILLDSFSKDIDDKLWSRLDHYALSMTYPSRMVAWMVATKMAASQDLLPELRNKCKDKEIDKNFAIFKRLDLIPYTPVERWEKALDKVMSKLGYSSATTTSAAKADREAQSKIVYLISDSGQSVQPVLKKSKDGLTWSKGRNIALKTFCEGIPEMTDIDRAVASKVRVSSQYWGGKCYELGGPAVMSLLAGHGDIYREANPDIRVNIVEEPPYLMMETGKSGVCFKSNYDPENASNTQLVKETDILYKVITANARQKDIIRNLSGVTFPSDARDRLKTLLGYLGRDIVVHSDADEIQGACETVKASSALTLILQPEGEGLKVNTYVKPFVTEPPYVTPGEGSRNVMASLDGKPVRTVRNFKAEKAGLDDFLSVAEDILGESLSDGSYFVEGAQNCLNLVETLRSLGDGVRVEWPEGCRYKISGSCDVKDLNITVKSGINWFEMTGELRISEERLISMTTLLSLVSSSQGRFLKIGEDEFISLSDKLRAQVASLAAIAREEKKGKLGLPGVAVPVLGEMKDAGVDVTLDRSAAKLLKTIAQSRDAIYELPPQLQAELRPYQEDGYRWLCRLSSWGAGACLADDMGLGKTVQTLALLLQRAKDGPAIVVAPASVAANWSREIMRFAPALHVLPLNDMADDERKEAVSSAEAYDVVLTTYGVLLTQNDDIAAREWTTAVLDEAHVIKNRDTKSSSACMKIKAGFRMILTGTPLQNNVGELWNLFQFINPGYLGSFQHFTDAFLVPIQERGDKVRQAQLKKMVMPFMLRRTKSDVLEDLPPKTEQYIYVDMDDAQTTVYETIRREAELSVEEHRMNLVQTLSEITRLRMASCSPALVDKKLPRRSSKVDELTGLLGNLIEGGHKALVFSQFTSFLEIVRETLEAENIAYLYLDGSTPLPKRQKLVKDFQSGQTPVFLISLKAGGLGLNLTAADYIIHTDPWWNPAIEDQASDRAYRIGQSRPVTVYHILSRGTIEEKILTMHRDKRSLADALLEGTDISSKLSREEILQLING